MSALTWVTVSGPEALQRQLPHVDADAVQAFADAGGSQDGRPDADGMAALVEMQQEAQASGAGNSRSFLPTRGCTVAPKFPQGHEDTHWAEVGELEVRFEGGQDPPQVGTVLLITFEFSEVSHEHLGTDLCLAGLVIPTGRVLNLEPQTAPTCFLLQEYGMHEFRFRTAAGGTRSCRFMVSSALGRFAEALDHFNDEYDWIWDGGWNDEFEEATLTLLVAMHDYCTELETSLKSTVMGATMLSGIDGPKVRIEKYFSEALEKHDVYALGRATSGVRQFLISQSLTEMFSPMMGGAKMAPLKDSPFYAAITAFERARYAAASDAKKNGIKTSLSRLIQAADSHVAELYDGKGKAFSAKWHSELRELLVRMCDNPEKGIHPLPFQELRGGGGGFMADMIAGMLSSPTEKGTTVQRAETTESNCSLGPEMSFEAAEAKVTRWAESLVDDSISFGTMMAPFEVHAGEPWVRTVMAVLRSTLSLGFGYVSQGSKEAQTSKITILLDRVRAALPLNEAGEFFKERRRRDRLKDVCRVVRAAQRKGQRLTLSVNTDFEGALRALQKHHDSNWVGPSLESVWEKLIPEKGVFSFELWLHDAPADQGEESKPRLVAADFGHPHTCGRAYYVATRFFDREFKNLQPGFILAFAEAECLKRAGFQLWDLGGADHSPMMQYKPQVAIEMDRSEFVLRLRALSENLSVPGGLDNSFIAGNRQLPLSDAEASPPSGGDKIPLGVVFANIGEAEIWGAVELAARERQMEASAKAAAKAAKKVQKPPKAKRAQEPATAKVNGRAKQDEAPAKPIDSNVVVAPSATPIVVAEAAKTKQEDAKQQFLTVYNRLIAEGLPQNDAAAKALLTMQAATKLAPLP